jgi:H+-transporting ATPase
MNVEPETDLSSIPLDQLRTELDTTNDGLSAAEAVDRLARYGRNESAEKRRHPLLEFASFFWAPIPWMIEVALGCLSWHDTGPAQ